MNKSINFFNKIIIFILVIVILGAAGYIAYSVFAPKEIISNTIPNIPPPSPKTIDIPADTPTEPLVNPELHIQQYIVGDFGPEETRLAYKSGSMTLSVPRLDYTGPVLSVDIPTKTEEHISNGVPEKDTEYKLMVDMDSLLNSGLVIFNQSQLPGPENANVSIAGHRDYMGMEFYYIDTITDGDLLTLSYAGKDYIYEYDRTFITNDQDWSPIAVSDKSQLTLQSCDPIFAPNAKYDRIFVIAYLVDIIEHN